MKEMIYNVLPKRELLDSGIYNGFKYYIMNLGMHPTAYVEIPENHKYYHDRNYDKMYIHVHGGLTYSDNHLWIAENEAIAGWFIGWDYGHAGDYCGFYDLQEDTKWFNDKNKKWTTEEILEDVKSGCEQLLKVGD